MHPVPNIENGDFLFGKNEFVINGADVELVVYGDVLSDHLFRSRNEIPPFLEIIKPHRSIIANGLLFCDFLYEPVFVQTRERPLGMRGFECHDGTIVTGGFSREFEKVFGAVDYELVRVGHEEFVVVVDISLREKNGTCRSAGKAVGNDDIAVFGNKSEEVLKRVFVVVVFLNDEREFHVISQFWTKVVNDDLNHRFVLNFDQRLGESVTGLGEAASRTSHRDDDIQHLGWIRECLQRFTSVLPWHP